MTSFTTRVTTYGCYLCKSMVTDEMYPDGTHSCPNGVKVYMVEDHSGEIRRTPICKRCLETIREITFDELKEYKDTVDVKLEHRDKEIQKLQSIVATLIDKPKTKRKK